MVVSKAFLVGVMATIVISSPTPQHFGIKSGIGRQMNFRLHGNKFAVHNKPQTKCKTYGINSALFMKSVGLFKAILSYQSWAASLTPSWSHPPWFVGCTPVGPIKVWNTSFVIVSHPIFPSVRVKHLVEKIDKVQDLRHILRVIKYLEPTKIQIYIVLAS